MACRPASSSATAEDMMEVIRRNLSQINKHCRRAMIRRDYCLGLALYTSRDQEVTTKYVLSQLRSSRPTVSDDFLILG